MTKRKRFWVGCGKHNARVVFASAETPTEESHGSAYFAVIGPFRTKAGALYMAQCHNSPTCVTVADAERLAKLHAGQTELSTAYGKHLDSEIWRKRDEAIQAERDTIHNATTIKP